MNLQSQLSVIVAVQSVRFCSFCIGIAQAQSVWAWNAYIMATHTRSLLSITEFCIWNTDSLLWVHDVCVFFSVLISIAAFDFRAFVFVLSVSVSLSLPLSLIRSSPSAVSNEIFDNSFEIFGGFLQRINQTIVVNNYVEMEYFQIGKMRIVFRWVQLNIPDFITLVRSMHKHFFFISSFSDANANIFLQCFFFCSFLQVSTINEELNR